MPQQIDVRQCFVYMVVCSDDSYYIGITNSVERRVWEHNEGFHRDSYTFTRRPVALVYSAAFDDPNDAIAWEKQIKGWSRAKKRALVRDDWVGIHEIVTDERKRRKKSAKP